jgi:hypothetical protein
MAVSVVDLAGKDAAASQAAVEAAVTTATADGQVVAGACSILEGAVVLLITRPPDAGATGPAGEVEAMYKLYQAGGLTIFEYNDFKKAHLG